MMRFVPRFLLCLTLLVALSLRAQETRRFRAWEGGREAGGSVQTLSSTDKGQQIESREWMTIGRLGTEIRLEVTQVAYRRPDGGLRFTWNLLMSKEPLEGEAEWSPRQPGLLVIKPKGGTSVQLSLPPETLLWPKEIDDRIQEAARLMRPVRVKSILLPLQVWTETVLQPLRAEALPGFPDTVLFSGTLKQGPLVNQVKKWVSPTHGEVKTISVTEGLSVVTQRAELPAPGAKEKQTDLFERSLKTFPPHPFLPWLKELTVRWSGKDIQALPEDSQQSKAGENRYRLRMASLPSAEEAADLPIAGKATSEDALYLAESPLVPFKDPVFLGLSRRMNAPEGATRWELARRVNDFVFEWITDKDMSVGFASASEVARTSRGDCTEHGVLAVAMLRRLGVPARCVTGWVALEQMVGLHFWVEVKLKDRWIPIDPTFCQAPASAFRLKLGTSDLADLGSVMWDSAAKVFGNGQWIPEGTWTREIGIAGDTVRSPDGSTLRVPGATWRILEGMLILSASEVHHVSAIPRPYAGRLADGKRLQAGHRTGWWVPGSRNLFVDLGNGRWLRVDPITEREAFQLLDSLEDIAPHIR